MGHLWFLRLKIDEYVRQSDVGGDSSGPADLGINSADLIGHPALVVLQQLKIGVVVD